MEAYLKVSIIFTAAIIAFLGIQSASYNEAESHQSGCHRWHTCPSDSGSYTCGDLGHECKGGDDEDDDQDNDDSEKSSKSNDDDEDEDNFGITEASDPTISDNVKQTLPKSTLSEGIEISGPINYVVDGDTLEVNQIPIRLSLVNTPEVGEAGFSSAKSFVEEICLDKNGEVDIDGGQRQGSFGRQIGVVYCDGANLNSELMSKGYAIISTEFCEVSEFSAEPWAKSSCQTGGGENNSEPDNSNQFSDSLSEKQEQQTPFDLEFPESSESEYYSNSKFGISLEHPVDWKVGDLKNGMQFIKETNGVYVEIRRHNLDSPDAQLKEYVTDYIKDRSTSREDFKLLNITETTISENLPAYKAIYTFLKTDNQKDFTSGGATNKILRLWTFTQDNAYLVAFVADKDKYDFYLPIAEEIIDTLKINPEAQQSSSDNDSSDNDNDNDSNDENDGGDKDCSDFDKKNFKVQPGDPYDLDRDGDGIACES